MVNAALGNLRVHLGNQLGLIPENTFNFLWVTEFPLFEYSEEEKRYVACHHPFTSPAPGHLEIMNSDPARALARAYDMVLNGNEVGGGSIRIHSAEVQRHMFQALGFTPEQAEAQFGFLIQALEHGARRTVVWPLAWTVWSCCFPVRPASATSSPSPRPRRPPA